MILDATAYWTIGGIIVSVSLFLVGYRQTIGAKKERVTSANSEIEKILVRRIVLDSYALQLADVSRLREAKALDFRTRSSDLLSEEQLLTIVFTRILETDFLPQDKRDEILTRLSPVVEKAARSPETDGFLETAPSVAGRIGADAARWSILLLGVAASVLGALVTALPSITAFKLDLLNLVPVMIVPLVVSVVAVTALAFFLQFRDSQEKTAEANPASQSIKFERAVADVIAATGIRIQTEEPRSDYDFAVSLDGKKIFIEAKYWRRPMPLRLVAQLARRLEKAVKSENASEAIIVTPSSLKIPHEVIVPGVRLMGLDDLRKYLSQAK